MEEQTKAYGMWYYGTYLLMRIICWFVIGVIMIHFVERFTSVQADWNSIAITTGSVFSMVGGFFLGIYHVLIEE